MKNKATVISTILCLLPMLLSLMLYEQLPEQIAVHFNSSGNPDNYLPKALAAFALPVILAAINLYSHFRLIKDPEADKASASMRSFSKWLVPALSLIIMPITLFWSMGKRVPIVMIATVIAGLVIVVIGNYLPKCRRNYSIGIKLPWTVVSEDTWNHTHRLAGFAWVLGGLIIIANAFVKLPYLNIAVIIFMILLPFVYSYVYYSGHKEADNRK